MNIVDLLRYVLRNLKWIISVPIALFVLTFLLTMNQKKTFKSSVDLYTGLASGFDIASGEDDRLDYFAVNNAFDNIISIVRSRATIEETGIRLLAWSIAHQDSLQKIINPEVKKRLGEIVPKQLLEDLKGKSQEWIYLELSTLRAVNPDHFINKVLSANSEIYSTAVIASSLVVKRKLASDLLEITLSGNHPRLAQRTLEILIDVFSRRYRGLKSSEIHSVVAYFEEQRDVAYERLKEAEERLRDFGTENKIINYNEQTKFIAESKQEVERDRQIEMVRFAAAEKSLERLNQKMEVKKNIFAIHEKISDKKKELSDLNYRIAQAEILNDGIQNLDSYQRKAEALKEEMKSIVDESWQYNNTTEGLNRQMVLKQWLEAYLTIDESRGRLEVINARLKDFDKIYNEFAPIGSSLKRLERETEVYESEYLEALHSLNLAKLREQNVQFANKLSVIAAPNYPLNSEPSKRKILVILAAMMGAVFSTAFFVIKALLDTSIRTPEKAEKITKYEVQSGFPDLNMLSKKVFKAELLNQNMEQLIGSTKLRFEEAGITKVPKIIGLYSIQKGEGKTRYSMDLARTMAKFGYKVEVVFPKGHEEQIKEMDIDPSSKVSQFFMSDNWYFNSESFQVLDKGFLGGKPDFIIIEIPDFSNLHIPVALCHYVHLLYMVLDVNRSWKQVDQHIHEKFQRVFKGAKPELLLNNLFSWHLEDLCGEIPKVRSPFRQFVKGLIVR